MDYYAGNRCVAGTEQRLRGGFIGQVRSRRHRLFQYPSLGFVRPATARNSRAGIKPIRHRLNDCKCSVSGLGCRLQTNLPQESSRECRALHRTAKHGVRWALTLGRGKDDVMRTGRTEDRQSPHRVVRIKARETDWEPIRGLHQGQRSCVDRINRPDI